MERSTGETGTRDATYNLVSILYHALQGAETYDVYIQDADRIGDEDLSRFFRDVKERSKQTADDAKRLLGRHLAGG